MAEVPAHEKYPEKFAQINQDEGSLRIASYQIDIQDESAVEKARELILKMESLLIIEGEEANPETITAGNIIGYGLAACQLKDVHTTEKKAPRIGTVIIPEVGEGELLHLRMINPQIMSQAKPFKYKGEGCLSFPGKYLSTKRYRQVRVGFIDGNTLEPREMEFHGFEAVVMQHEIDHHDGKVFMDHHEYPAIVSKKIGGNDPCPCGKLKADGTPYKYKKCCQGL